MEQYISDGEPHALDKENGYILKKTDPLIKREEIREEIISLYEKYAHYVVDKDKESAIKYIMDLFKSLLDQEFIKTPENTRVIYRAPDVVSPLGLYGTVCVMFKRSENDGLDKNEPV